ncbi:MAG: glycosyltransferase family 2 protein [Spirochaetes bacterium]|nr:glycosyltransferase family 2 protein [Spirochaetota bacterium]
MKDKQRRQNGTITCCMITKNEERNIGRSLKSVSFCDRIIVIDDYSTDNTASIARKHGAAVIKRRFDTFSAQKQFAVSQSKTDWVLMLDADEVISDDLKNAVIAALAAEPDDDIAGFFIGIRSNFLGAWIRYSGWDIRQLRLFRRSKAGYDKSILHERIVHTGKTAALTGYIMHYSYPDVDTVIRKVALYSTLSAKDKYSGPHRLTGGRIFRFAFREPCNVFFRYFITRQGFRDGGHGFLLACYMSILEFFTQVRRLLREAGLATEL